MSDSTDTQDAAPTPPTITVARGNPTAEEVAAMTVLFAAIAARGDDATPRPAVRGWSRPGRRVTTYVATASGWRNR